MKKYKLLYSHVEFRVDGLTDVFLNMEDTDERLLFDHKPKRKLKIGDIIEAEQKEGNSWNLGKPIDFKEPNAEQVMETEAAFTLSRKRGKARDARVKSAKKLIGELAELNPRERNIIIDFLRHI